MFHITKFSLINIRPTEIDLSRLEASDYFRFREMTLVVSDLVRCLQQNDEWRPISHVEYRQTRKHTVDGSPNLDLRLMYMLVDGGYLKYSSDEGFSITDRLIYLIRGCVVSDSIKHE